MLRYHKREDVTFIEHASWKFVPLGGKTGKNLGAQIDIINTLSTSMAKIFSQLLSYLLWMMSTFHFQVYMPRSMAEIDSTSTFYL